MDMEDKVDVIIIGAGLTGLTLATSLAKKGKSFLVLEARNRIGGRIHTLQQSDGALVEMGATWFFPHFKNLYNLLKQLNVELEGQYLKGYTLYESDINSPVRKVYSNGDDDMFRIRGGTKQIVDSLYREIDQSKVMLGQTVKEIRQVENGMEVKVKGAKVYKSDKVVTTIPQQLLVSSVAFTPSLSKDLVGVMKNTHTWMGDSVKAAVTYRKPFWKEEGLSGALYSYSGPFIQMYDQSGHEEGYALVGFLHDRMGKLSKEQRKEEVINQLVRVFGRRAKDYLDYAETVWKDETFTMEREAPRLSSHKNNGHPLYQQAHMGGRLIIGGTETAIHASGYMEGAINSARSISKMLYD